jgi:aminopeptidase
MNPWLYNRSLGNCIIDLHDTCNVLSGGKAVSDIRVEKMARVLVDYSVNIQPGDRVLIESTLLAEPLVREVYRRVLERGGHPHLLLSLPDQDEIFFAAAKDDQLDFVPALHQYAVEQFDARIRVYSEGNTRSLTHVDPARMARRQKALAVVQGTVFRRAGEGSLRWISTQYPTMAYAMEAEMGFNEYQDFFYSACHADDQTPDPVAFWKQVGADQQRIIQRLEGHDRVVLKGPDVDLRLSIQGRKFLNSCGIHNLPDGEVYTGPVEDSVEGWVRFTYPAIYAGQIVEGVELTFEKGRVAQAKAQRNEPLLLKMLETDAGAKYVGEFAIGTNYQINRFTRNILFDEKIGGTFHMALGAGYPETGSLSRSVIHWDMICALQGAEINLDGETIYRDGKFTF